MSVRKVGYIEAFDTNPYLYVIIKAHYLYIGRTLSHPAIRWGSHLQESGTFFKKIFEQDEEIAISNEYAINFYAFSCAELKGVIPNISLKRETEYAETLLHTKFFESELAANYKVVSMNENIHDSDNPELQEKIVTEIIDLFKDQVYNATIELGNDLDVFNL